MHVTVKLFAALRERAGTGSLRVELPDGADTGAALEAVGRVADLGEVIARMPVAMAVNRLYADVATPLADGDEVALIPPVSGG